MKHHPDFSLGCIEFMQMGVHPAHHQINQLVEAVKTVEKLFLSNSYSALVNNQLKYQRQSKGYGQ